jgi:serine/threonine protein phosphatase 1
VLYAVGDIHGERGRLEKLLASLPLLSGDRFVFMGDYVDRGPDSRGVVELLIEHAKRWESVFLCGNHESMFLDFLGWSGEDYFGGDAFLANGGDRTLSSYGYFDAAEPDPRRFQLPPAHRDFFRNLRMHHREGDYVFVHAGLGREAMDGETDLTFALRKVRGEDLLWDRTSFELPHRLGVTVVYGHTPSPDFEVRWNLPWSIGIDTGAVYGGRLTAIRLPDEAVFQV